MNAPDKEKVPQKETPEKTAKSRSPAVIVLMVFLIVAGGIGMFLLSPAFRLWMLSRHSTIYIERFYPGYNQTLQLIPRGDFAEIIWDYRCQNEKIAEKKAKIDIKRYYSLFEFFDGFTGESGKNDKGEPGVTRLWLKYGPTQRGAVFYDPHQKEILDMKVRMLEEEYLKEGEKTQVRFPFLERNPRVRHIAHNVNSSGCLFITWDNRNILYNKSDGHLAVYRTESEMEALTGKSRLIASNFEALGLIILRGENLVFWEKKNLANLNIPLAEPWTKEEKYRKVLLSAGLIIYNSPSAQNQGINLMEYDFLEREFYTLIGGENYIPVDISVNGSQLLLKREEESTGENKKTCQGKTLYFIASVNPQNPNPVKVEGIPESYQIFGFFDGGSHLLVFNPQEGELGIMNPQSAKISPISLSFKALPVKISEDKENILLKEKDKPYYYIYRLSGKKIDKVNETPVNMENPYISFGGKKVAFFSCNCLFLWEKEENN